MSENCSLPSFSLSEALEHAARLFGVSGKGQWLNGERDLNCLINSDQGRFVFKIANADEDRGMLDCQHELFQHLGHSKGFSGAPVSRLSVNGHAVEEVISNNGTRHYCRMLSYLDGRLLSQINPHSAALLESLGGKLLN